MYHLEGSMFNLVLLYTILPTVSKEVWLKGGCKKKASPEHKVKEVKWERKIVQELSRYLMAIGIDVSSVDKPWMWWPPFLWERSRKGAKFFGRKPGLLKREGGVTLADAKKETPVQIVQGKKKQRQNKAMAHRRGTYKGWGAVGGP